jgi:hypothetical protein
VEELGLPDLTGEQIEKVCSVAEEAARKHVLTQVPPKKVEALNVSAEAEGTKPLRLTVEVDVQLSSSVKDFDVQQLCDDAVKQAFTAAEECLKGLACHSPK